MEPLSYESHVTVEYVDEKEVERFETLCALYGFKRAKLLMKKGDGTSVPSTLDMFGTAHGTNYKDVHDRMMNFVGYLNSKSFKVLRYKLEAVLIDSKVVVHDRTVTTNIVHDVEDVKSEFLRTIDNPAYYGEIPLSLKIALYRLVGEHE